MSEILETLFGSKGRARLIRFFLLNSTKEHTSSEIAQKNMLDSSVVRKELNSLKRVKFIQEKSKKKKKHYKLNRDFPLYSELKDLVVRSNTYPKSKVLSKIKNIGDVKLALVGGIFLNDLKSKVDMVIVANDTRKAKLDNFMNSMEAEMGKEIRYVLMNKEDFKYRMDMLDRFLLDFFEGPKNEIINKMPELRRIVGKY